MKKLTVILFVIIGMYSCNENQKQTELKESVKSVQKDSVVKYNSFHLRMSDMQIIDSSDWIMFPLTLEDVEEAEEGFESDSYSSKRSSVYWNIIFYNSKTKEKRLLSSTRKMLVNSLNIHSGTTQTQENEGYVYYTVTINDINNNGVLDADDPDYLFVSDFSGKNFKQVSPTNYDIENWEFIEDSNKILIQARKDSNKDNMFELDDELVSFIYTISNEKIERVFSDDFTVKTKKLFEKQWVKKK